MSSILLQVSAREAGWLAILLGRFRMDATSCLSEWYNLMDGVAPESKATAAFS